MSVSVYESILQSANKKSSINTNMTTVLVVLSDNVLLIFDSSGTSNSFSSSLISSLSKASRFKLSSETDSEDSALSSSFFCG